MIRMIEKPRTISIVLFLFTLLFIELFSHFVLSDTGFVDINIIYRFYLGYSKFLRVNLFDGLV